MSKEQTDAIRPRFGEADPNVSFEMEDRVFIDFQDAGQLGPGVISGKIEFDDGWSGYLVRLNLNEYEDMEFGWIGSSMLKPCGSNRFLTKA